MLNLNENDLGPVVNDILKTIDIANMEIVFSNVSGEIKAENIPNKYFKSEGVVLDAGILARVDMSSTEINVLQCLANERV